MKHKITIYSTLIWVLFGIVYLYPHPEMHVEKMKLYSLDKVTTEYFIQAYYAGWYQSIIVFVIGITLTIISVKKQTHLLLFLSMCTGAFYSYYRTELSILTEQTNLALNHSVHLLGSGIAVILKHMPNLVFMELLFFYYVIGMALILVNLYKTHNKASKPTAKSASA